MPQINPALLARIANKLGVGVKSLYPQVQRVASRTMLDRHLAALVFASEKGINIQRFSTPEERALIRGSLANNDSVSSARARASVEMIPKRRPRKAGRGARVSQAKDNSVFVVHGRNENLRKAMFEFLRALGLNPKEWSHALQMTRGTNPWTLDVVDTAMAKVQAVVVMLSPDDEARLKPQFCRANEQRTEGRLRGQPRANVIFEAGLALGRHPTKTLLVQIGEVRGFTDIVGKHIPRLSDDPARRNDIANRLRKIGCKVDTTGDDWRTTGDFAV